RAIARNPMVTITAAADLKDENLAEGKAELGFSVM
ncbi:unnamed protein product, partial [marine sediment metagenome]